MLHRLGLGLGLGEGGVVEGPWMLHRLTLALALALTHYPNPIL